MNKEFKPSCSFCGAIVNEISQQTEQMATAIYDCSKCYRNYCDQCSYSKKDNPDVQLCLRCDSLLEKVG